MLDSQLDSKKRAGFTMIELIFSIVIVGLVILSIPLIIRQSNLNTIMSQNVIGYYNAMTLMETIKSKPWDTSNINDFVSSGEYYILNTDESKCENIPITMNIEKYDEATKTYIKSAESITGNTLTKRGLSLANKRRMCDKESKTATAVSSSGSLECINDFDEYTAHVYSDYPKTLIFRLKVNVDYVDVNFGSGTNVGNIGNPVADKTTDVKRIRITLIRMADNQEVDTDGEAVFTYYAANIGNDIPLVKDNVANQNVNP